jgi:hypothetical protein
LFVERAAIGGQRMRDEREAASAVVGALIHYFVESRPDVDDLALGVSAASNEEPFDDFGRRRYASQ